MSSKTTPPRELLPIHQRRSPPRAKYLRRISDSFVPSLSFADSSTAECREATLRKGGLLSPSRALTWPLPSPKFPSEPVYFSDQPLYDADAAKRRRENALCERGLLSLERALSASSAPVSGCSSNSRHRDEGYLEKDLLPPHDKQGRKREATTLGDGIQSLGTHAEHVKTGRGTRRKQTQARLLPSPPQHHGRPFSSLEVDVTPLTASPIRQRTTPASPSDDLCGFPFPFASASVPGPRCPAVKGTDTFLTRSPSSPASLSGELLHLRQPLDLKVFTPKRMAAKLQKIGDDESRRLTRLAFMM